MIVRSGSEMQSACSDIRVKVIDKERTFLTREYTRMAYIHLNTYVVEKRVSDI